MQICVSVLELDKRQKPFGSNSTPNLSVDSLCPPGQLGGDRGWDRSPTTPNRTPPPSPCNMNSHSPLTLSPKLSDIGRKFVTPPAPPQRKESKPSIPADTFHNQSLYIKKNSKFPLTRRKVSDSAVPISYSYFNYQHASNLSSNAKAPIKSFMCSEICSEEKEIYGGASSGDVDQKKESALESRHRLRKSHIGCSELSLNKEPVVRSVSSVSCNNLSETTTSTPQSEELNSIRPDLAINVQCPHYSSEA